MVGLFPSRKILFTQQGPQGDDGTGTPIPGVCYFGFNFWEEVSAVDGLVALDVCCFSLLWPRRGYCFRSSPFRSGYWAPRPTAFRLRGQDPLTILALGDLQWVRGPFCSHYISSSSSICLVFFFVFFCRVLVLSRPGAENRDPSYPLLSIARPSRLLRGSGGWLYDRRGAVGILFLGFGDCQTLLVQGSCFALFRFLCDWLFKR